MGGTSSKSVTEQINEHITNISVNISQECTVAVDQEQSSTIVNTGTMSGTNVKMNQVTDIDLSCLMKTGQFVDMQRGIANAIVQAAEAKGEGMLSAFGASSADAEAKIHNIIKNNVTIENVNKSMIAIRQRQRQDVINTGTMTDFNLDMNQGSKVFATAMIDQLAKTGITENIDNNVKNRAESETKNPLSFITDLFGVVLSPIQSAMNIGTIFFILVFCVVAYVVYTSVINPKPRPQEGLPMQPTTQVRPLPATPATQVRPSPATRTTPTTGIRNRAITSPARLGTAATNTLLAPA